MTRIRFGFALALGVFAQALLAQGSKALEGEWVKTFTDKQGVQYSWVFVLHVDGDSLTGFMRGTGGTRRALLHGEAHGTQLSMTMDDTVKISGKLLPDGTLELTLPPSHEGPRVYVATKTPGFLKTLPELPKQRNGVDQSRMGAYRALANLAYETAKQNDMPKAAMFAQILERVWDEADPGYHRRAEAIWLPIDKSMDAFIGPIFNYKKKPIDTAEIETLYRTYLDKLKAGDVE